jgi:hypothetical protein
MGLEIRHLPVIFHEGFENQKLSKNG